mmetsp:Transcript_19579/g.32315  ORF Transcript_19579/g.32315 Transcript_19579/m.32315 type:complete len:280 (+) Transcript_19579:107-946(+)
MSQKSKRCYFPTTTTTTIIIIILIITRCDDGVGCVYVCPPTTTAAAAEDDPTYDDEKHRNKRQEKEDETTTSDATTSNDDDDDADLGNSVYLCYIDNKLLHANGHHGDNNHHDHFSELLQSTTTKELTGLEWVRVSSRSNSNLCSMITTSLSSASSSSHSDPTKRRVYINVEGNTIKNNANHKTTGKERRRQKSSRRCEIDPRIASIIASMEQERELQPEKQKVLGLLRKIEASSSSSSSSHTSGDSGYGSIGAALKKAAVQGWCVKGERERERERERD